MQCPDVRFQESLEPLPCPSCELEVSTPGLNLSDFPFGEETKAGNIFFLPQQWSTMKRQVKEMKEHYDRKSREERKEESWKEQWEREQRQEAIEEIRQKAIEEMEAEERSDEVRRRVRGVGSV